MSKKLLLSVLSKLTNSGFGSELELSNWSSKVNNIVIVLNLLYLGCYSLTSSGIIMARICRLCLADETSFEESKYTSISKFLPILNTLCPDLEVSTSSGTLNHHLILYNNSRFLWKSPFPRKSVPFVSMKSKRQCSYKSVLNSQKPFGANATASNLYQMIKPWQMNLTSSLVAMYVAWTWITMDCRLILRQNMVTPIYLNANCVAFYSGVPCEYLYWLYCVPV